jgi:hypothetical protein
METFTDDFPNTISSTRELLDMLKSKIDDWSNGYIASNGRAASKEEIISAADQITLHLTIAQACILYGQLTDGDEDPFSITSLVSIMVYQHVTCLT